MGAKIKINFFTKNKNLQRSLWPDDIIIWKLLEVMSCYAMSLCLYVMLRGHPNTYVSRDITWQQKAYVLSISSLAVAPPRVPATRQHMLRNWEEVGSGLQFGSKLIIALGSGRRHDGPQGEAGAAQRRQ